MFRMLFVVCAFPPSPSPLPPLPCLLCLLIRVRARGREGVDLARQGMGAAWAGGWLVGMSRVCDAAAGVAAAVVAVAVAARISVFSGRHHLN